MGWVLVVRPGTSPQGQRKEPSGLEGKSGWPCMEENELYSSSAAGEGPLQGALLGCGWEEV